MHLYAHREEIKMTNLTMRIPAQIADPLNFVAAHLDRSRSYIALKALEKYIAEQIEDILDGEKALAAKRESDGEYVTWEEAEAMAAPLRVQR
jgi:predicted transcriptional regulator